MHGRKAERSRKFRLRRALLCSTALLPFAVLSPSRSLAMADAAHFIAEAFRMRELAIASGDQAYGAVIIVDGTIAGYGPSRVVVDSNADAHAERVALWDAQRRLGRQELEGAVIYSTSRPCTVCQQSLVRAGVARMYVGRDGDDHGAPQLKP